MFTGSEHKKNNYSYETVPYLHSCELCLMFENMSFFTPASLLAGILVHCIYFVCKSAPICTHACVCIGLLEHGFLGDRQAHFHVFEQSYESFHARYLAVFLSLVFLLLWILDMDNLGRWHFQPFSIISYPSFPHSFTVSLCYLVVCFSVSLCMSGVCVFVFYSAAWLLMAAQIEHQGTVFTLKWCHRIASLGKPLFRYVL